MGAACTPRHRVVAAAVAAVATAAAATILVAPRAAAQDTDLTTFIDRKKEVTATIAEAALKALTSPDRCESLETCGVPGQCSYNACGWRFDDTLRCTGRDPNPEAGCGGDACTEIKMSTDQSFVIVPPSTFRSTDGLVPPDEFADTCLLRGLDAVFVALAKDTVPWAHINTPRGVHRVYPGQRREHTGPGGACRPFDPRLRPWYASAASGPLDVVIAIDRSAGMGRPKDAHGAAGPGDASTGRRSVLDDALDAAGGLLGSLDWSSYVGAVRYDDRAEVLGGFDALAPSKRGTVQLLTDQVADISVRGERANLTAAVDAAAKLFEVGYRRGHTTNCTRVLFLLTGTEDGCVSTACGPQSDGPCTCTSDTLAALRKRLGSLEASLKGPPVTIMALTFGNVDDAVVRQLTCGGQTATQGLTVPMTTVAGNVVTAVDPATRWLSTARRGTSANASSVFFSERYEDDVGYGDLITAALPIYSDAGVLLAVAGVDIPVEELRRRSKSTDVLLAQLAAKKATCTPLSLDSCAQQRLRAAAGAAGACAETLNATSRCYTTDAVRDAGDRVVWYPFLDAASALSRRDAAAACAALTPAGTARLATVRGDRDAAALAAVLGADGAWVGATRTPAGKWVWDAVDGQPPAPVAYTRGWRGGALPRRVTGDCVLADRRGIVGNWVATPCDRRAPFVCEVLEGDAPPPIGDVVCAALPSSTAAAGDRVNPPPSSCKPSAGEAAHPECTAALQRDRRPFCELGDAGDDCDGRCCEGCTCLLAADQRGGGGEAGGGVRAGRGAAGGRGGGGGRAGGGGGGRRGGVERGGGDGRGRRGARGRGGHCRRRVVRGAVGGRRVAEADVVGQARWGADAEPRRGRVVRGLGGCRGAVVTQHGASGGLVCCSSAPSGARRRP